MAMPKELAFVRHGESEANVVYNADKAGKKHPQFETVTARPDWMQRLSRLGIEQAHMAKQWIDRHLGGAASFDIIYNSVFLRGRETAGIISGDSEAKWTYDNRVIERSWGIYGTVSIEERERLFPLTTKLHMQSPWFTKLDGGQSRDELSYPWRNFQDTLHREADGKKVLVVTHGDFMGVARYNIERLLPEEFEAIETDKSQTIKNCTIMHYSRVNPDNKDDVRGALTWRRIVYPTDPEGSPFGGLWVELPRRRRFTGTELLGQVEIAPRLLDD